MGDGDTDKTAENGVPNAKAAVQAILDSWGEVLAPIAKATHVTVDPGDKRFSGPEWDHPLFDLIRQSYLMMSQAMMATVEQMPGDAEQKTRMAFAMQTLLDAMSPSNSPFTNPVALQRALETDGASLSKGMAHLMSDFQRGQLTHTDPHAFEVGRNIATTPGKVIYETPLFQLIHYTPTTKKVLKAPLVIFPPWINRFYILDLNPQKSFVRWAVEQGLSVFIVSWKSADASMRDIVWDDYINAQIAVIDLVRDLLDVKSVHVIGYCVAGTTLAATLAVLAARGEAKKVKSATFFTALVDFARAGDLLNFIDPAYLALIDQMSSTTGYLDGRVMAATFNSLRGRSLIWNYVVNNYLMGEDYPAFDLLHWNGDSTNLPARWHRNYLADLYRDNKLVQPGAMVSGGTPIDLTKVETPTYVQAGREDHIAPADSVFSITKQFRGPMRFVLAGSGHIAGVVNPPSSGKYQYWLGDRDADTLAEFVAGATETKGSWWPDWIKWITSHGDATVPATDARIPGGGKLKAIEDAPGRYVMSR